MTTRKTKPRKPKATVNSMLRSIDAFLSKGGRESEHLWNILTALRGPDDGNSAVKTVTTARVRTLAFPRTAVTAGKAHQISHAVFGSVFGHTGAVPDLNAMRHAEDHFQEHIQRAYDALCDLKRVK